MEEELIRTRIERAPESTDPGRTKPTDITSEFAERSARRLRGAALIYAATYLLALTTGEFVSQVIGDAEHDVNVGHIIGGLLDGYTTTCIHGRESTRGDDETRSGASHPSLSSLRV